MFYWDKSVPVKNKVQFLTSNILCWMFGPAFADGAGVQMCDK